MKRFQLPSHSLQQVAAAVPASWEVTLVDEVHEDIPFGERFDLVGITAMTHQATRAYEIADRFRAGGSGGHGRDPPDGAPRRGPRPCRCGGGRRGGACHGALLDGSPARTACPPLPGAAPRRRLLTVPWPRREILAGKRYLTTQTLQASRGCPYDCPFCTVTPYFGRSFRYRDPEDILAELRTFSGKLTVFLDDNILGDPERARPILKGMVGMGLKWGGQANLRFAEDPELVRLVADSGCIGIFVGIESVTGSYANLPKTAAALPPPT